jgi:alpha-mannosidase
VPKSIEQSLRMMDTVPLFKFGVWNKMDYDYSNFLPDELSFLSINNPNICLSAFKRAENDEAIIIRLFNISNEKQVDDLSFYKEITAAKIVNLNEEEPENEIRANFKFDKNCIRLEIDPHVIVTINIKF